MQVEILNPESYNIKEVAKILAKAIFERNKSSVCNLHQGIKPGASQQSGRLPHIKNICQHASQGIEGTIYQHQFFKEYFMSEKQSRPRQELLQPISLCEDGTYAIDGEAYRCDCPVCLKGSLVSDSETTIICSRCGQIWDSDLDLVIGLEQVAEWFPTTRQTANRMYRDGELPTPKKIGKKLIWLAGELRPMRKTVEERRKHSPIKK